jgi:hypothetical protein
VAAGHHRTRTLPESGCSLVGLEGFHPRAETVRDVLRTVGFEGDFGVSALPRGAPGCLVAHIQTPRGLRRLSTT